MGTILKHELKANFKTFLIWCLSVSFMSFMCILMFTSVKESMVGMAESFASMGAFSNAFGMDKEAADYRACATFGPLFKK